MEAFNFNYNTSSKSAEEAVLYPLGSNHNYFTCKECWAYIGATTFFVADWGNSGVSNLYMPNGELYELQAGVTGEAGFSMNVEVSTASLETSVSTVLVENRLCFSPILVGAWMTITPNCVSSSDESS